MARLNETSAPATIHNPRISNGEDQPSYAMLEAGKQTYTLRHDTSAMRTKSRLESQKPPANHEEVKRNLMRQNRNLARSHSAQSLQIRILGTEISNLIALTTTLKEENITLKRALSKSKRCMTRDGIEGLRKMMSEQMSQMGALLESLVEFSPNSASPESSPETRKMLSLESMRFRDRPSLREIMSETQMPAIQEMATIEEDDPRLGDAELDSPDLGPPPIARFQNADMPEPETTEEAPVNNSINIEARRKRKDSVGSGIARRRSTLISPLPELEHTPSSLKTGAKRKISDRDRDDVLLDGDEPFQFSRRRTTIASDKIVESVVEAAVVDMPTTLKPARRALAEKSTNLSPKKARPATEKDDVKAEKKLIKQNGRRTSRQPRVLVQAAHGELLPAKEIEAPPTHDSFPRTPAALEILSPASSEPCTRGIGKADTPPPGDLSISSSTTSIEGVRPSRRARASVNYAEPSLVAKMRRPGKEMLDALSGLQDPRNVMNTSASRRSSQDIVSKSLFGADTMITDSRAQNKRSPLVKRTDEEECELSPIDEKSTALSLATLMTVPKSVKVDVPEEDLDIYDFKDTTPPDTPPAIGAEPIKGSRRHSAASKASIKPSKPNEAVSFGRSSSSSSKNAVRRKSMMV